MKEILTQISSDGTTSFLMGDHNMPSHYDSSIEWPVSKLLEDAGFADCYRMLNPEQSGVTWPYRKEQMDSFDKYLEDRVDFIYARSGDVKVKILDAFVFEKELGKWPSDHKAVIVKAELSQAQMRGI